MNKKHQLDRNSQRNSNEESLKSFPTEDGGRVQEEVLIQFSIGKKIYGAEKVEIKPEVN